MQDIHSSRWLDRLLERSPDYASFALVITCGFLLARLVWALFPANPTVPVGDIPAMDGMSSPAATQNIGEKIANFHLFGQYSPNKPAAPVDSKKLQDTQLALKLQGVYARPGKQGQAVIEEGGQQHVYAIGENIGNSGSVLEEIHMDHVVLKRNGNLEKLQLPEAKLSGRGGAPMQDMPDDQSMPIMDDAANLGGVIPPPDMGVPDMPPPDMPPPDMGVVPAEAPAQPDAGANLSNFRDAALNNNAKLLEAVSPQPYEANGKFLGFRLMPGSNPGLFNKAGLQPGDIVTAINGTMLDSPAAGMQALQSASTASQISLSVTRGGQQINLPLSF
jgi:general secretion pathway protein C